MRRVLQGKKIARVDARADTIVLGSAPPEAFSKALVGRTVEAIGRKGKYFWLELDQTPWLFGHLGMSGWIRLLSEEGMRLKSHGKKPFDEKGEPRFLKLMIEAEDETRIAFTDGRRLGRLWLADTPSSVPGIAKLGFDSLEEMPSAKDLYKRLVKRNAPLKAILLDQGLFAGVGNWVADESLYHARLNPKRLGSSLSEKESATLRKAVLDVLTKSVDVDADYEKYPETWLFHHRWGGKKGAEFIGKHKIVREEVGGRTTAWVPAVQK